MGLKIGIMTISKDFIRITGVVSVANSIRTMGVHLVHPFFITIITVPDVPMFIPGIIRILGSQ